MQIYQALILGTIQGLTEFLPISSSAHLNLLPWVFNWETLSEGMDVALHIGTLLALGLFFFKDWIRLIVAGYKQVVHKQKTEEGKFFWYLVFATLSAGILSLILDKIVGHFLGDDINLEMAVIGATLIIMGIILYIVDKRSESKISYDKISLKQSMLIGISQALAAAIPGVSRSGITITTARALKIDRKSTAKFSFLLATPITFGAVVFEISHFTFDLSLLLGILTSFVIGILVIKFLLDFLKKGTFKIFAIYRVIIGIAVLTIYMIKII